LIISSLEEELALTELEALEESVMALEGLALDSETARVALASGTLLKSLIEFVEFADYPASWSKALESDRQSWEKNFDICKGALIKAVVAVAGETRNFVSLWSAEQEEAQVSDASARPTSWFATRMLQWISLHSADVKSGGKAREDLVICGTLCLGNLARDDSRASSLLKGETDILPHLLDLLQAQVDIKVKNGAVGLLKNLSQPTGNRGLLGERGIIEALSTSRIWLDVNDMAEIVQGFGIGVCKHLANGNVDNALKIATSCNGQNSALEQIMALVKRSDTVAIKSEGTRVLVNVVKAIFSNKGSSDADDPRLQDAMALVIKPEYSSRLAEMLARSQKYPILINESLVSMTLIAARSNGEGIIKALTTASVSHPVQASPVEDAEPQGAEQRPTTASQAIVELLSDKEGKLPPEIKANACSLITAVARVPAEGPCKEERALFKQEVYQSLQEAAERTKTSDQISMLQDSLNRALKAL